MIYTEITPNPASLKFVVDRVLIAQGSADFPTVSDTEDAPIARKLFDFRFVERVFIGRNFITVSKGDDFTWEEVIPAVKDFIKGFFASEQAPLEGKYAIEPENAADDSDVVTRIKNVINDYVRPAVARDGGDIVFETFEEGTGIVRLRMQGSCSGCPSSTITLKTGIEGLLTRMVPEVQSVESV